jgi:hypothetical protein
MESWQILRLLRHSGFLLVVDNCPGIMLPCCQRQGLDPADHELDLPYLRRRHDSSDVVVRD